MLNKKTKISWDIITEEYSLSSYQETVSKINLLCDAGILYPVKNSGWKKRKKLNLMQNAFVGIW